MFRARVSIPALILPLLIAQPVLAQDTRGFPLSMAGQGKRCDIDVQWHDTISNDGTAGASASPPAFEEIFSND